MITTFNEYMISFFLIVALLLSRHEVSHAADTINTSEIFRDDGTTITSSRGIYEMGFFSPENSNNRYLGIWYMNMTRTVVWVANGNNPLRDGSGTLTVTRPGFLALLNSTNGTVWSTNTSRSVQDPVAQLLNTGNLVVRDAGDDNEENFLWQSFDYPTDTFLPGMKLGVNFVTGREVYLTSLRSRDDPAPGDYTFHCDPTGYPQFITRRRSTGEVMYRSGPWNGVSFGWNPTYVRNNIYTFGVVINENEVYYHSEQLSERGFSRFTLNAGGSGNVWIWADRWVNYVGLPLDNCDNYRSCGAYGSCNTENSPICRCLDKFDPVDPQAWARGDWSSGCNRSKPLDCQKGDGFLKYSRVKLPDTRRTRFNGSMTLEECKEMCLRNCSCTGYSSLDLSRGESGCLVFFGDLVDIKDSSPGQDIYIRMSSSELASNGKKRRILIVTLSLGVGIVLLSLMMLLYLKRRKKIDHHPDESHEDLELPLFDFSTMTKATNNFSFNNKLGEGGFGPVYMGILENGQEIAVKCLSRTSRQGIDEFKNEVICIAKLQHRNLVKLLGWCIHREEMMMVYEYMANKSLDLILFDPTKRIQLDWPRRFNIINGIARGLMYLHQDSRLRVIHRDLKASNILLDSDMNPKISDFGMARTFGGNETEANTNRVVGTYGYMSPEYVVDGIFSVKSDVFSYGVIVLEIVSGKRNRGFHLSDHGHNLLGHAWILYKEERSLELVDSSFRDSCNVSEILRSIHIGLLCVQESPEDRPSMSSVVLMLSNENILPEPKRPGFFATRNILDTDTSTSSNTPSSRNPMTVSTMQAR